MSKSEHCGNRSFLLNLGAAVRARHIRLRKTITKRVADQAQTLAEFVENSHAGATSRAGRLAVCKKRYGVLQVIQKGKAWRRRLFTWQSMSEIAHAKPSPLSAVARCYKVSARTIGRILVAVAHAHLRIQSCFSHMVKSFVERNPPDVVIINQMWDETAERLVFDVNASMGRSSISSGTRLLESRRKAGEGTSGPDYFRKGLGLDLVSGLQVADHVHGPCSTRCGFSILCHSLLNKNLRDRVSSSSFSLVDFPGAKLST